jgi:hypothetical protein
LQSQALAASASAKLRLGVVRENLAAAAAGAAGAAETSIASIAAGAGRIKLTAAAMVASLIMVVAVPLTRNWQTVMAGGRIESQSETTQNAASPASRGAVDATVASLESLVKAQGNLEHWRRTLVAKLSGAVGGALQQVALRATGAPAEQPVRGERGDGHRADAGVLPEGLAPCLTRMVGLIEDVAAQTGLAGLEASLEGVRMIGGVRPAGDQPGGSDEGAMAADPACLPSDALVTAAVAADAVTICVGTTISEINAVATQEDRDLTQATADIMRMVAELNDQLAAIRDRDWQLPSTVG